jgi:hypothetical protein
VAWVASGGSQIYFLSWLWNRSGLCSAHAVLALAGFRFHYPFTEPLPQKKALPKKSLKLLFLLVRPAGFEPATYGFVVRFLSIPLFSLRYLKSLTTLYILNILIPKEWQENP